MADYKDLLRRALAALPDNLLAARRAVYEKARAALVAQLRQLQPPLPARDITQHRLKLEDDIREVEEAEVAALVALVDELVAEASKQADEPDRTIRFEKYRLAMLELNKILPGLGTEEDEICRSSRALLESAIRNAEEARQDLDARAREEAEQAHEAAERAAAEEQQAAKAESAKAAQARVRVIAPPENAALPRQHRGVPTFDETGDGRIDLAPAQSSDGLDPSDDIREAYMALRHEAEKLLAQGNGNLLGDAQGEVAALLAAMPADLGQVRIYPLWRAGNKLRRLYRAHMLVAGRAEGHPSTLDPGVAEFVGGLCDEFNNLASTDAGLRRCDQRRVPPQEAVAGQYEQLAPVIADAIDAGVATTAAAEQIVSAVADEKGSDPDPYALQDLDLTNEARQNFVVKLLSIAFETAKSIAAQGLKQVAIAADKIREGFYANLGAAVSGAVGTAILGVVVNNGPTISSYVATTFNSPNVNAAVDWLLKLFSVA